MTDNVNRLVAKWHRGLVGGALVVLGLIIVALGCRPPVRQNEILAAYREEAAYGGLIVAHPLPGTLFPPDLAPPIFRWQESPAQSDIWLVRIRFQNGTEPLNFLTHTNEWKPPARDWETIKQRSLETPASVIILGVQRSASGKILSGARLTFQTSRDAVGAPIFYREVNLPFLDAVKDPTRIRWRYGSVSSAAQPPVVLENLPVCGNCHSFSADGTTLAMDVDYANNKGSYVITSLVPRTVLAPRDIITWDDYRKEDGELTFGLLSQISPDGQYVISTVKDKSVFVGKPDLAFSQLFFPIKGILAIYHRGTKTYAPLPGADDPAYVQSNPVWSPDGKYIVFARSQAYQLKHATRPTEVLLSPEDCQEFLRDGLPFRFDLYRIPFNGGRGGAPEPLPGAAHNGRSNYFPKYSPDGKWIVFCQANSYMLLQPDSELYLIPAAGGEARRLEANTARMNSWHSWSPNSKWLVFSSKANSPYTQLFLTHLDDQGHSSPAVCLSQFSSPDRAANIPEFVNASPAALVKIEERFLNDLSLARAGYTLERSGEVTAAIRKYQAALELNPKCVQAHQRLGYVLDNAKNQLPEAIQHSTEAVRLDPQNAMAHFDLGTSLMKAGQLAPAVEHLATALRLMPKGADQYYHPVRMNYHLGQALYMLGHYQASTEYLATAVRMDANHAEAHYLLGCALARLGAVSESMEHYANATTLKPSLDRLPELLDLLGANLAKAGRYPEAIRFNQKALEAARALGRDDLAQEISQRLEACQQNQSAP